MAPKQKPGRSKQDYQTPEVLLDAIKKKLNIKRFWCDFAATTENAVADCCYTKADDAFKHTWNSECCDRFITKFGIEWGFCNPPYADIRPWVAHAWVEAQFGAQVAMLIPASTGSNWWATYVHNKAHVLLMNGRVTFVGADGPFPKDTALLLYTPFIRGGYDIWKWK